MLSKTVKRIPRAVPKNLDEQKVVRSVGYSLNIELVRKVVQTQRALSDADVQKVQKFHKLDSISSQIFPFVIRTNRHCVFSGHFLANEF